MDTIEYSNIDFKIGDSVNFIFAGFERHGKIERITKPGEIERIIKVLYFIRAFDTGSLYPVYRDSILNKIEL